jgi:hypothetical protein
MHMKIKEFAIKKNFTMLIFILIEICIYISFMYIDIFDNANTYLLSNNLKFAGIIVCLLYVLLPRQNHGDRADVTLLRGAILFTFISDLFILMLDNYIWGVFTFCIVQFLYLIRLAKWRNSQSGAKVFNSIISCLLRNLGIAVAIIILLKMFGIPTNGLMIISVIYFISILFNVIDAFRTMHLLKSEKSILFAISILLFLCCDINVGIFNLSDYIYMSTTLFSRIYQFSTIAMWMFYLPAQVGISLTKDLK